MKQQLIELLDETLSSMVAVAGLGEQLPSIQIETAKNSDHGEYASNIAMMLAKPLRMAPWAIAEQIVAQLKQPDWLKQVAVAGPGFINFFLSDAALQGQVACVLAAGPQYGHSTMGQGQRVHLEFVSANPTGPLHVGHGRGAAYGASLANLLSAVGYVVEKEYYVNDAGRQMHILALSVWLRYLQECNESVDFPANAYQGGYIIEIAQALKFSVGSHLQRQASELFDVLSDQQDADSHIDALIEQAKRLLGSDYQIVFEYGLQSILQGIQEDLADFRVNYEHWFHESSLVKQDKIKQHLQQLAPYLYEKEGATWFRTTDFGDEKDRVVLRSNGQHTYFAADIAYHLQTYDQGFAEIIDIFGADHHGYIARVKAILAATDCDTSRFKVLLIQFASLFRGKEKVAMSTRSGEFVTLRDLYQEVGVDAARYFYITRKSDQHLEFDMTLAKSKSNENPVYYIQYAHARICQVFSQLAEQDQQWDQAAGEKALQQLNSIHEQRLLRALLYYPAIIEGAAKHYEPHRLAYFLQELATNFHAYYNAERFLVDNQAIRNARLCLIAAVRQVIYNTLTILGISSPHTM